MTISIEYLNVEHFDGLKKIPIQDAEMYFLKQSTHTPSVQDQDKATKAAENVKDFLMELSQELLPRRGWCFRPIPEKTEIANRCGYDMTHCEDYSRWKNADEVDFSCETKNKTDCLTAGYCSFDGTTCTVTQTTKSKNCSIAQEKGQWDLVCEKTNFKGFTSGAIVSLSFLIFLLILVSIIYVETFKRAALSSRCQHIRNYRTLF